MLGLYDTLGARGFVKRKHILEFNICGIRKGENMKNFNRTQSLEEAIETADEMERKLKECDLKCMTDEEALKEIADLANEIDLSWFK